MVETVGEPEELPPVDTWINKVDFRSTAEVKIPERLVDQVIGQERAVEVIRKASEQKRHVMLIGDPGTGKSMLARSMTEMLPRDDLQDIIVYHNPEDPNEPKIRVVPAGKGREIVNAQKAEAMQRREQKASMVMTIVFFIIGLSVILSYEWGAPTPAFRNDAPNIILFGILVAAIIYIATRYTGHRQENLMVPKLLVTHTPDEMPPFIDATGSHAGALLGDVKHDPFQSGGLETPAHERVESGAIREGHNGVLFVDEINVLRMESQQSLLTAMQEKKFSIVGQSERSSGAMVKTEAVPCDFILVAAGNLDAVQGMHPALRSRIRGYGYEIYMKSTMPDSDENRLKLVRFVAQEVAKDRKIPHFDRTAVLEILREAQRRAGRRGQLTLRLRELGGLIRVAGDIAKEAVENVSALIKKYTGEDISNHDIHVQFVGSREGTEGDSASISVATAVISALEEVPVNQTVAMTGSLSVRGQVLPVGGVTAKIEAAAELGLKRVVIPRANMKDVLLEDRYQGKIEIVPVDTLSEVLEEALVGPKKSGLISKLVALVPKITPDKPGPAAVPH